MVRRLIGSILLLLISFSPLFGATENLDEGMAVSREVVASLNSSTATSNSQGLSGLSVLTNYHYEVKLGDADKNLATSGDYTLTAAGPTGLKQLILVGVDGMQLNHYNEMRTAGQLPNFTRMIGSSGWTGSLTITGHAATETAPGNAELHSGLNETLNGIHNNTCSQYLPNGVTIWERLNAFSSSIALGSVYGKQTCYIPNYVMGNAVADVDWWHDRNSYTQRTWVSSNCADSRDVATKALEFINVYKSQSFYLVVYFGAPDCSGHAYGENSSGYSDSFTNVDQGLDILLDGLETYGINNTVKLILTADHGFNEGSTGHGTANSDTLIIPLVSNDLNMVGTVPSGGRKQCDVAPTILNYFGMGPSDYEDITDNGCGSMLSLDTTPPSAPRSLRITGSIQESSAGAATAN